jgi:elongation factor 1-beta
MANVVVSYKIFPTDITVDFEQLKKSIERSLPEFASIYGYGEEPIAFGLKALIAHIKIPEDKSGILEKLENKLQEIENVSQIQTIMVRRTR